jgi:uncharacterized membrane protein
MSTDNVPSPTHEAGHLRICEACRNIDGADGLEDGLFGKPTKFSVRDERSMFASLRRAEGNAADMITRFAGSMKFIYGHIVWFGLWISVNIGLTGFGRPFDKFPFGLLTLVVSLEAIFLSTFVMLSQNRSSARADIRSQLDFETNLRSEVWAIHIGAALGIDAAHVEETVLEAIKASEFQLDRATAN